MTLPPWLMSWLLRAAVWAAVAGAGAVLWQHTPVIGPSAAQARLRADLGEEREEARNWRTAALGWETAFRASERTRASETKVARAAVDADAKACNVRVAEARRSSAAIRNLVTKEPARDAQGCPTRTIVRAADGLRDALQGPAR